MTRLQENKYWREFAAACKTQGWTTTAEKDHWRKAWHAKLGLPASHKEWSNAHFNRWIHGTAHLRDAVDIRDRSRENVTWTIDRLRAAFVTLLGHDYARAIMADWRDTADTDNFPVSDPPEHDRDQDGNLDPRDAGKLRDLQQLRNTLKNRLGRVIQRIKDGTLTPGPDCPAFGDASQADIIAALINQKPATASPARKYTLSEPSAQPAKQFKARKSAPPIRFPSPPPPAPAPDPANREYCMHALPTPKPQHPKIHHAENEPF